MEKSPPLFFHTAAPNCHPKDLLLTMRPLRPPAPDRDEQGRHGEQGDRRGQRQPPDHGERQRALQLAPRPDAERQREDREHTSELQSQSNLVCRLLLEKKKKTNMAMEI